MRCSWPSTRAASAASSSSLRTVTAACTMIGPASISADDEMHAGAVHLRRAGFERALVRVEPLESRQQRGVDVEHALRPLRDEFRREQPHETGKADDVDAVLARAPPASPRRTPRGPCRRRCDRRLRWRCRRRAQCPSRRRRPCSTAPARFRPDNLYPSPPRSAPPCWSRGRKSERRRACGSSRHPSNDRAGRHRRRERRRRRAPRCR